MEHVETRRPRHLGPCPKCGNRMHMSRVMMKDDLTEMTHLICGAIMDPNTGEVIGKNPQAHKILERLVCAEHGIPYIES